MNKIAASLTILLALLGGPAKDIFGDKFLTNDMVRYRVMEVRSYVTHCSNLVSDLFASESIEKAGISMRP
ncbi:MAG: hypothetical protein RL318_2674 [Fibrobacterota bacterium]|jgi:hypothetical protein